MSKSVCLDPSGLNPHPPVHLGYLKPQRIDWGGKRNKPKAEDP